MTTKAKKKPGQNVKAATVLSLAERLNAVGPQTPATDKRTIIEEIALLDDDIERADLVNTLKDRAKMEKRLILRIIDEIRNRPEAETIFTYTTAEKAEALRLLKSPSLLQDMLKDMHLYYQGRDDVLILAKLCATSRHFDEAVGLAVTGPSSVGKSEAVGTVLDTVNPDDKIEFTRFSPQYLAFHDGPLSHKIVVVYEMQGLPEEQTLLRTAISEHMIRVGSVDKGKQGDLRATMKIKDTTGMVLVSTCAHYNIEDQLSTRLLVYDIVHDERLAAKVNSEEGQKSVTCSDMSTDNGQCLTKNGVNTAKEVYRTYGHRKRPNLRKWAIADSLLKPSSVDIPYGEKIAAYFPTSLPRYLRDHKKFRSLIAASALLHQYQRDRNEKGEVVAAERDFEIVLKLKKVFDKSSLPVRPKVIDILQLLNNSSEMKREDVAEILKISDKQTKRYVDEAIAAGFLRRYGEGRAETYKVLDIPDWDSVLPKRDQIFPSPENDVRMSNKPQSVDSQGSTSDMGNVYRTSKDKRDFEEWKADTELKTLMLAFAVTGRIPEWLCVRAVARQAEWRK